MIKFLNTTWLLVFSVLLTAPEVCGLRTGNINPPDVWGNNRVGLLARTINSQKPTRSPTVRPTEPTASPTESPAPSPSPSSSPTKDPDRDTEEPTESPTESPAPSPSPSATPTASPSDGPTPAPTLAPSKSSAPSSNPTDTPSSAPSDVPTPTPSAAPTKSSAPSSAPSNTPSAGPTPSPSSTPSASPTHSTQPSGGPSMNPSMQPTSSPSANPTDTPSAFPSDAPSMSPTDITDRTKTSITTLLLEEIPGEMDRMMLAEFEVFTLDFLRRKLAENDDYVLNTLAVTVLSQKTVYNTDPPPPEINESTSDTNDPPPRNLESENWTVALEIDIRTVSVVTDGRVPLTFNFTEIVLYSFYNHWDQYLWQLGNSVDMFKPLVDVSDYIPVQSEASIYRKGKGTASFVIAVMFSFVAFGLAIFASYIAIRKHMLKNGRNGRTPSKKKTSRGILFSPKNSPMSYSGADVINYLTQTMSDDKESPQKNQYHDGDVEGGGALGLIRNVNIDVNEHGMESVVLTPQANFRSPNASIRNGLFVVDEGSDDDDRSPLKSPMVNSPMADQANSRIGVQLKKWLTPRGLNGGYAPHSNRRLSSDPPENQSTLGYNYGREHMEPDAIKASTKNHTGVYTTDKSTVDGRSKATGISYNKKPSDDGQFTLPISFFSNRGPGTNVSGADSPMSSLADSNASSFFAIGNMNKSFTGQRNPTGSMEDEGYEVSALKMKMNNLSSNNSAPVVQDLPSVSNKYQPSERNENTPAAIVRSISPSESSAKKSAVKLATQRFEKQQQPLREIQPPNSTVGVETILGARSRDSADDEDKRSEVSSSFLKNRSMFSPNTKKEKKTPVYKQQPSSRYRRVNVEVQEQDMARSVTSHSTLGARPMTRKEEDGDDKSTVSAFSTLSNIMRRPGCYDVYAPSGPIGIVVDTSKDGPSVHSLKSTSPMLGLISPGDLIVALDGEDTRKMTAAALTRLMARKSRHKERKITLLS